MAAGLCLVAKGSSVALLILLGALFVWWQVSVPCCHVVVLYLLVACGCFPMSGGGACLLVSGASANPNSLEGGEEGETLEKRK